MKKKLVLVIAMVLTTVVLLSGCDGISLSNSVGEVKYKVVENHAEVVSLPNGSNDKDITIEDEFEGKPVTIINNFAGNNLESAEVIHIGKNIEQIGKWSFSNNQKLTTYDVDDKNQSYCDVDGVLYTKDMKLLVSYPCSNKETFIMPDTVEDVYAHAFYKNENITSITLSKSLKTIEEMSFFQCSNLQKIEFPNMLETIGKDAFTRCTSLKEVTIPSSIKKIEEYAFYNCTELKSITVNKKQADIELGEKWYPTNNGIKIDDLKVEYQK